VFSVITYFMAGLRPTAGAFFTFYLFIVLAQATMTVFFRTLGCISANLDSALRLASIIIILMILDSGYLVPYMDMRPWVKWFYWLNPVSYDFSGMMMNEFKDLTLTCTDDSLVPSGSSYTDLDHQVCLLAGAQPGTNLIDGLAYLKLSFGYDGSSVWRNVGIMVAFIVGLLALNALAGELVSFGTSSGKTKSFKRSRQQDSCEEVSVGGQTLGVTRSLTTSTKPVSWQGISYTVPMGNGTSRKLIDDVNGYVQPGTLMALMGASGAGKSTLLDLLSMRKSVGNVSGQLQLGGQEPGPRFQQGVAYCEQLDTHELCHTVREALLFSAHLRQDSNVSKEEKAAYVEQLIEVLEMTDFADTLIGTPENGLSVEERKRLTIGVELAAKPDILLFLDEPTSGLDSQSALNIVRFLRKLADGGQAIICTIHQPSAVIFGIFDQLLLLNHGRTVYFGPTEELKTYFDRNGALCASDENIAEFMIQTIGRDQETCEDTDPWADRWAASTENAALLLQIQHLNSLPTQVR
jgi:ATP-binding cassette, subfamily G (WHITE), member 2, SNQ2